MITKGKAFTGPLHRVWEGLRDKGEERWLRTEPECAENLDLCW